MNPTLAMLLGASFGAVYFIFGESHQAQESNCSYLAPASTDAMAIGCAVILMFQGHKHNDPVVSGIGGAIAGIHTGQYLHYKAPK